MVSSELASLSMLQQKTVTTFFVMVNLYLKNAY